MFQPAMFSPTTQLGQLGHWLGRFSISFICNVPDQSDPSDFYLTSEDVKQSGRPFRTACPTIDRNQK